MQRIYLAKETGKFYLGDNKGVTATRVYPDINQYTPGTDDGVYIEYRLREISFKNDPRPVISHR